jgi:hypothetical protein
MLSPLSGFSAGSVATLLHTSVRSDAVKSRISLWRKHLFLAFCFDVFFRQLLSSHFKEGMLRLFAIISHPYILLSLVQIKTILLKISGLKTTVFDTKRLPMYFEQLFLKISNL